MRSNQLFAVELNGRGEICVKMANEKTSSIMPELADLTMLALLIGGFALAFRLCPSLRSRARVCCRQRHPLMTAVGWLQITLFGRMVGSERQGWTLLGVMAILFGRRRRRVRHRSRRQSGALFSPNRGKL
jgi:hypothetical protein